ncbi:MAG: septum formation protein Maf [Deltaproteobacteria bacterium]|nr:septum formation protein Maf [Deltaproteobacteria bacterium]
MKKLILASSSPRRVELLKKAGFDFEVCPSGIHEVINPTLSPQENATQISKDKARHGAQKKEGVILAADTFVVCRGKIFEKPKDKNEAFHMIQFFSGVSQDVITGFTILDTQSQKEISQTVLTRLRFRKLNTKEIKNYIDNNDVTDKSGGYAIQEIKDPFIEKVQGSFTNVIGLPIEEVIQALKACGIEPFDKKK